MAEFEKPKSSQSPTTPSELRFGGEYPERPVSPAQPQVDHTSQLSAVEDAAPPKPPRPAKLNPVQQAENTLKEAFPSIDIAVIKAVLRASGGNVEPAFNALLEMSDPGAQTDDVAPPPQPPRRPAVPTSTEQSQLAADEQYARQLAEHYQTSAAYGGGSRGRSNPPGPGPRRANSRQYAEPEDERERSFIDDDLPVIRDNIKKGFLETQARVNSWVTNFKKKIDGEEDDDFDESPRPAASGYNAAATRPPPFGRRSGENTRRSADHDRYDADPQVLGDDFTNLHLKDYEPPQPRSSRPLANPDLFKPTPARPSSNNGRRVSFQDGPPEEIGFQQRPTSPPDLTKKPSAGTSSKSSKWQPLASVDPDPVADHDPFSLGDSEDEEVKKKDIKADDNTRPKETVPTSMTGDKGSPTPPTEQAGEVTSKDQGPEQRAGKLAA